MVGELSGREGIPLGRGWIGKVESGFPPRCLTIARHAHGETLLKAALLAAVAVNADDGAVLILQTLLVLDVLLDAPAEEALEGQSCK